MTKKNNDIMQIADVIDADNFQIDLHGEIVEIAEKINVSKIMHPLTNNSHIQKN